MPQILPSGVRGRSEGSVSLSQREGARVKGHMVNVCKLRRLIVQDVQVMGSRQADKGKTGDFRLEEEVTAEQQGGTGGSGEGGDFRDDRTADSQHESEISLNRTRGDRSTTYFVAFLLLFYDQLVSKLEFRSYGSSSCRQEGKMRRNTSFLHNFKVCPSDCFIAFGHDRWDVSLQTVVFR